MDKLKSTILHGTIVIISVSIIAKITSFISTAVLAAFLGTSNQSDAINTVLSVEQVFYPMLGVGIWKVFLPIYKEKLVLNRLQEADKLANKTITLFTLFTLLAVILLLISTSGVVNIIAPGFNDETKTLCIRLIRISAPMYVFIIAAAIYSSMLQCHNRFLGSQIREIASHIPVILMTFMCYQRFGIGSIAFGMLLGGGLRLIVELPFVNWGFRFHFDFHFRSYEMLVMVKRYPSAMISEGINQINVLVDKVMASSLVIGSVSALTYGNKLTNVLSGLLSTALSTALYPQIIELISLKKKKELQNILIGVINIFSFVVVPITIGCILFSSDIVSVVYERGVFNQESVNLTSGVFAFYCVGLFFVACNAVITNVFYAYGDTKTPMYISLVNLAANIILNFVFIYIWNIKGLALATSISASITFCTRFALLKKYIDIPIKKISNTWIKSFGLSIVICSIVRLLCNLLNMSLYVSLVFAFISALILYILIAKAIRMKEIELVISFIVKRLVRKQ